MYNHADGGVQFRATTVFSFKRRRCSTTPLYSNEVRKAIISSMEALFDRIKEYEKQGICFERIFNDDKIKYDKHGKFFTFKIQKSNMQLRILYSYFVYNNEPVLLIADYFVKKKNKKDYIKKFDLVNKWEPFELLSNAYSIA